MEVLLGMILFLQMFALVQNMLAHRRMLQKINKQEKNIEVFFKEVQEEKIKSEQDKVIKNQKNGEDYYLEIGQAEITEEKQKAAQEALINEVLSEVFS